MSFRRAARAALAGLPWVLAALLLAAFSVSCVGSGTHRSPVDPNHSAYVTLPETGAVLQLHIDGATGTMTLGSQTPQVLGATPTGIAILPSKKFVYAINSFSNSISIFSVAGDGSLNLTGTPVPAGGSGPNVAVIDPSGKYLLVTNNLSDTVSVFSIDSSSGALTPTAGSPFAANSNPAEIIITPTGDAVYVTNPGIGMVTAFSFADGILTQLPTSPVFSGRGASGLAIDATGRFLYVANPTAVNPPPIASVGNISGFNIDPATGELTPILGSPFTSATGTGPTALAIDPGGRFVYATTTGASFAIWCFSITPSNGQLVPVTGSPFSVAGGSLFALFDPTGNFFYIGSQSGNAIEGYTYNPNNGTLTTVSGSPFSTGTPPGKMVLSD